MADQNPAAVGEEPPSVAALSVAGTEEAPATGAVEQKIDPWSVTAGTDAEGNELAFDYPAISKCVPSAYYC